MLRMYQASGGYPQPIRCVHTGGYADMRQVHAGTGLSSRPPRPASATSCSPARSTGAVLMRACGTDPDEFRTVEFYAAHEGLVPRLRDPADPHRLPHRPALRTSATWSGSASAPGSSTARHVEYFSKSRNPIAISSADDVARRGARLHRQARPGPRAGRLTFIRPDGRGLVRDSSRRWVEKVTASGAQVVWVSDPMHVNASSPERPQNPALRRRPRRGQGLLRGADASVRACRCRTCLVAAASTAPVTIVAESSAASVDDASRYDACRARWVHLEEALDLVEDVVEAAGFVAARARSRCRASGRRPRRPARRSP